DFLHHPPDGAAHTLIAGDEGLEVLIFGSGSPTGLTRLPRARVLRVGAGWWPPEVADVLDAEPPLDAPAATSRALAMSEAGDLDEEDRPPYGWRERNLGGTLAGLRHAELPPLRTSAPPHWHTAEEERFVMLAGDGTA